MTDREKSLAERVAYLEDNVQGLMDFAFHMAKLFLHRDLDRSDPDDVPAALAAFRSIGEERVAGRSHTRETLIMELYRQVIAERAMD